MDGEVKTFHCRNQRCKADVGVTNGYQLRMTTQDGNAFIFTRMITFMCGQCGHDVQWRPVMLLNKK